MPAPTYATLTTSMTQGGSGQPAKGIGRYGVQAAEVNIANFYSYGGLTTQSFKLINVPANTKVIIHAVWNKTALVGTSFSVGDSADEAHWVSANSTTTINTYATLANTTKNYTAADFITFKSTAQTSGTVVVFYELIDLTANSLATVP